MIEFNHVALHYHYDEFAVLKDLNFTLNTGVNTILCDTQSGKTSVCKLLTKQFAPTSGQILIDGKDIAGISNESLGILYMPAKPVFFENRSVKYNVTYPLTVRKVPKPERIVRLSEVTAAAGLTDVDVKVKKLSEQSHKCVAVARGLTVKRKIVLLDDFCGNAEQLDGLINLFAGTVTVILTSDIAFARGNVVVLDGGVSVFQGDAKGATECRSRLGWIADLIGEENGK